MTIKELKAIIQDLPDDMQIIIQKSSDGTAEDDDSPAFGADGKCCVYIKKNDECGRLINVSYSADELDMDKEEWKMANVLPRVLVLWPVN